jgi:DNA modification methylase
MAKKITDLQPQQKNVNLHKEHGERLLRKSVQDYGIGDGITVAANDEAISGSMRIETLADMMPDVKIQVVETYGDTLLVNKRMDIATPDTKRGRALSVASNQVAASDWNPDFALLKEWAGEDEQIKKLFSDDEWREGTGEEPETADAEAQIDRAAELQVKWQTETGQLWQLGNHRLLVGDCTVRENVDRLMGGERAELLFTSPPYADMREYSGGDMSVEKIAQFIPAWKDGANYYAVNLGIKRNEGEIIEYWNEYIKQARDCGMKLLSWNIWNRHGFGGSVGNMTAMFPIEHEFIFIFGRYEKEINLTVKNKHGGKEVTATVRGANGKMSEPHNSAVRSHGKMGTVLMSDVSRGEKEHPAQFPEDLPLAYIEAMTDTNEIIAEPFAGSGTTIIAAQNLGRRCFAMEISPAYCAVILQRFSDAFPNEKIEHI